jgi:hypothetical protein
MSYSFRLPEADAICECRYDVVRDRMDCEDCPFHCDTADDLAADEVREPGAAEKTQPADCEGLEAGMKFSTTRKRTCSASH